LQWNNWVQIIKKDKNPSSQEATRVTALSHHTFSLRVVCHGRALSARVMHAPGLANGNAPHVSSGQTFNLFKLFVTSLLFSHFQQPTSMVSTYWKWLSISHCRWSNTAASYASYCLNHMTKNNLLAIGIVLQVNFSR